MVSEKYFAGGGGGGGDLKARNLSIIVFMFIGSYGNV